MLIKNAEKFLIMKVFPCKFLISVCLVNLCFLIQVAVAVPTYRRSACTDSATGNLTTNSTYYTNLNLLLSYLTSNATLHGGFYQITVAAETPDAATGFFLCRSDIAATGAATCRECAANASREVLGRCPQQKRAIIWYDECWIRYEDGSAFATTPGIVPSTSSSSSRSVAESEVDRFNDLLSGLMKSVADRAANSRQYAGKKFGTDEEKFTSSQTVYSLAQCTPELSAADCNTCLKSAIAFYPNCCGGKQGKGKSSSIIIVAIVVPIGVALVFFIIGFFVLRRKAKQSYLSDRLDSVRYEMERGESFQFSIDEIEAATDNFSDGNKIGEGGFGEVYMGTFPNGQKIAVKRLLGRSEHGAEQFKNEALLVAKLQHRNLVRLLGFCLEREEKILIYEYVPNKSLDYFLFDHEKQSLLDWTRRYKIIGGIAREILYLHEDS